MQANEAERTPGSPPGTRGRLVFGLALFAVALVARLLFWRATPDAAWSYSAWYKGDTIIWLGWARALQEGLVFDFGLPFRPPGVAYLVAALWDGSEAGYVLLKLVWCVLGALAVVALWGALLRPFGDRVAGLVGGAAAASSGLLMLGTSVNNETPYLLLVALALWLYPYLLARPRAPGLVAWGILHAVACLTRVEHALFFAFSTALLGIAWQRRGSLPALLGRTASIGAVFLAVLAPWHLSSWGHIGSFNRGERALDPAYEASLRAVEERTAALLWDEAARAEAERLPGFARRISCAFVVATLQHRGKSRVRAEDFAILDQAFGSRPEPMSGHPFVTSYGGINFYLANNPLAEGGFNRKPLELQPPLEGGARAYPPFLVAALPPQTFSFEYPPHLEIYNRGTALGLEWIRANPAAWIALVARKLSIFFSGATLGLTGFDLPMGESGLRRSVDLVVPAGGFAATLWRGLLVLGAVAGAVLGLRDADLRRALAPWLAFGAGLLVVAVFFFGYARHGALAAPVLLLLCALALDRWCLAPLAARRPRALRVTGAVLLAAVPAFEGLRLARAPRVEIDGVAIGTQDPHPVERYDDRRVDVTYGER